MELQILHQSLLPTYLSVIPKGLQETFQGLKDSELSSPGFSFYRSVASVYSSKIEGEDIELDSFIKHRRDSIPFQPNYTKKVDDLYDAYQFAQENPLDEDNVKAAHERLSRHLLASSWQGRYRSQRMYVTMEDGRIEYVAAPPNIVEQEMRFLFSDISQLKKTLMSEEEAFYFASMIHLVFVKIHPWNDGNGRTARLLEKWFLSVMLGEKAWFLQSERMYYERHTDYYRNLRRLGLEYGELDYDRALPFLLMLPDCLKT